MFLTESRFPTAECCVRDQMGYHPQTKCHMCFTMVHDWAIPFCPPLLDTALLLIRTRKVYNSAIANVSPYSTRYIASLVC
jgi:hypothetical protein